MRQKMVKYFFLIDLMQRKQYRKHRNRIVYVVIHTKDFYALIYYIKPILIYIVLTGKWKPENSDFEDNI